MVLCSLADLSSGSASSIISALAGMSQISFYSVFVKCLTVCHSVISWFQIHA